MPDEINDWLQTVLSKEPADRYPDALTMRLALSKAMGRAVKEPQTTLPVADDTVRMAPDVLFMQAFGLSAANNHTNIDDGLRSTHTPEADNSQTLSPSAEETSTSAGKDEHTSMTMPEPTVNDDHAETETSATVQGLAEFLQEHPLEGSSTQDPDEPKETRKLTSLELLRAAQQSKVPPIVDTVDGDAETQKPVSSGNTALEDLPEALLGYLKPTSVQAKPEQAHIELKTPDRAVNSVEPSDASESYDGTSRNERKSSVFHVNPQGSKNEPQESLFSDLTLWLVLPLVALGLVAIGAFFLW